MANSGFDILKYYQEQRKLFDILNNCKTIFVSVENQGAKANVGIFDTRNGYNTNSYPKFSFNSDYTQLLTEIANNRTQVFFIRYFTDTVAQMNNAIAYYYISALGKAKKRLIFPYNYISAKNKQNTCLLYTSPSPRDLSTARMPSSA